jgi:hypothetical protein
MKKAKSHRKRHVPPGPVGIWFQTQQATTKQRTSNAASLLSEDRLPSRSQDSASENNSNKTCIDMSFSPVWTTAQQELNICTPYLPTWNNDPKQRYHWLRPHLPPNYILLWEILMGKHDFSTPKENLLLVLVHSIESHTLYNIWVVELQDETGLTVRAWMEPRYVMEQMNLPGESSTIRPGVLWMLSGVSMMVQANEYEEKLERILLVGGRHISKSWTPEEAKEKDSHDQSSQVDFLDWMEKRKAKSNFGGMNNEDNISAASNTNQSSHQYSQQERRGEETDDEREIELDDNEHEVTNPWMNLLRSSSQRKEKNRPLVADASRSQVSTTPRQNTQPTQPTPRNIPPSRLNLHRKDSGIESQLQENNLQNRFLSQRPEQNRQSNVSKDSLSIRTEGQSSKEVEVRQSIVPLRSKKSQKISKQPKSPKESTSSSQTEILSTALWDVQDTSVLQMLFDEDEDDITYLSERNVDGGDNATHGATASQNVGVENSTQLNKSSTQKGNDDDVLSQTIPSRSLFELSNFEGLDSSMFDENDDI